MTKTNIWERSFLTHDEVGSFELARTKWIADREHINQIMTESKSFTTQKGLLAIAQLVIDELSEEPTMSSPYQGQVYLNSNEVFGIIHRSDRRDANYSFYQPTTYGDDEEVENKDDDVFTPKKMVTYEIIITADKSLVNKILSSISSKLKQDTHAQIKWWFHDDSGGITYKRTWLPPLKTRLLPEFYPSLPEDPQTFLSNYLRSEAAILLVAGPPGTGKTTLLRHLICDFNLCAHVVYDEKLMNTDQVFQSFLFEPESDILIIEDADTILSDREHSDNKMMARFLNVSDGLIKLPNKKVVFTTNITDFGRVDHALVRPGRCFDAVHTGTLTLSQARAAAASAGLPMPLTGQSEYTIAELFNNLTRVRSRKVGF